MTPDLFPGTKPPRARPRVLMHIADSTWSEHDDKPMCNMTCTRCGKESGWLVFDTVTEAKRGIPCEDCNTHAPQSG